jgi:hypothetical protein
MPPVSTNVSYRCSLRGLIGMLVARVVDVHFCGCVCTRECVCVWLCVHARVRVRVVCVGLRIGGEDPFTLYTTGVVTREDMHMFVSGGTFNAPFTAALNVAQSERCDVARSEHFGRLNHTQAPPTCSVQPMASELASPLRPTSPAPLPQRLYQRPITMADLNSSGIFGPLPFPTADQQATTDAGGGDVGFAFGV